MTTVSASAVSGNGEVQLTLARKLSGTTEVFINTVDESLSLALSVDPTLSLTLSSFSLSRACPLCRTISHFVIPVSFFVL